MSLRSFGGIAKDCTTRLAPRKSTRKGSRASRHGLQRRIVEPRRLQAVQSSRDSSSGLSIRVDAPSYECGRAVLTVTRTMLWVVIMDGDGDDDEDDVTGFRFDTGV